MATPLSNWREWCRKIPAPAALITIVLCLGFQENFPFSDFPMYARMAKNTSYIYVSDGSGAPLPIAELTSVRTSRLKKIYTTHLDEIRKALAAEGKDDGGYQAMTVEQRRPAGEETLKWLYENSRPAARKALDARRPLHFHVVEVRMLPDNRIERKHLQVAELK